jgi:glycosyltransferase involved in cell wall biosynthesis
MKPDLTTTTKSKGNRGALDSRPRMKILWIYPELPYPLTSGFLRGFHLLRLLGQRHSVTFLSLTDQKQVLQETFDALKQYAERIEVFNKCGGSEPIWLRLCSLLPVIGGRLHVSWNTRRAVKQMAMTVRGLLKREIFDLVLFHGREALPVLDGVDVPIVVECGDTNCTRVRQQMHHAHLLNRPRLFFQYVRERKLEEQLASKTSYRFFISTRDRENLLGPSDRSEIVPQGVDYDYWKRRSPPSGRNCIVFSGVMSYTPNADAALFLLEAILPLVRRTIQHLEVLLVGRDPSPQVSAMAQRFRDVTVTGAVADVRPYLERADVFVAALRFASGVQNKVLEAMAMEVPVVTTPVVAAGLCVDGVEPQLVIGHNAGEIATGIVELLANAEERARLSLAGRRFVEAHCSWTRSAEKLENLCLAAAGHRSKSHSPDCMTASSFLLARPKQSLIQEK